MGALVKSARPGPRQDPEISRFLQAHGRSGVPLYLYYSPDGRVQELPQLLSPGMLTSLVQRS